MRFVPLAIRAAALALAAVLPAAASAPLESLVAPQARQALAAGTPVVRPLASDGSLALVPVVSSAADLEAEVRAARPNVGAEVLLVLRGMAAELDSPEGRLRLYNSLHAVSTMKGITYWSASRKQQRVLFTESFAVPSARETRPIPDPLFTTIPGDDTMYTFQQDQSYGRNTYAQRFTTAPDHLVVRIRNTSTVTVALIPLVQPGGFVSTCVLVPAGRDLLFYGVSYIRTSMPLGDKRARQDSLSNRLIAMADWLRSLLA